MLGATELATTKCRRREKARIRARLPPSARKVTVASPLICRDPRILSWPVPDCRVPACLRQCERSVACAFVPELGSRGGRVESSWLALARAA